MNPVRLSFACLVPLAGAAFAQTSPLPIEDRVVPREIYRIVEPSADARLSFTVLHTRSRNWLQAQIEPLGGCQQVYLDSVGVLDSVEATGGDVSVELGGTPRRTVVVKWSLAEKVGDSRCLGTTASRFLRELPSPRKRPSSDTLLVSWAPKKILALGPGNRVDTAYPAMVDHAGDLQGRYCLFSNCQIACISPDSAARAAFLDNLRKRIDQGLPVVRITSGGAPVRVPASIDDTAAVKDLGPLSKWNVGNLAWGEDQPIRSLRSWGPPAPSQWLKNSRRRIYRWRNDSVTGGISALGATVEVSNDSIFQCWSSTLPHTVDAALAGDLTRDWLITPDSGEVREARLRSTFQAGSCGRERAWEIEGDSIKVGCVRVAVSDLEKTLSTVPRRRAGQVLVMSTSEGLRVRPERIGDAPWSVVVRDASGRFLARRDSRDFEETIPLVARGILVVEIRTAGGATTRRVAR